MRCWICGVEPYDIVDTSALSSPFSSSTPGRWPEPKDGHEHAVTPPTPSQLENAGHRALAHIRDLASGLA